MYKCTLGVVVLSDVQLRSLMLTRGSLPIDYG